ncbi:MAG: 3'(2'),5'-bisphosphate nucleotidase [Rickettsiales bacterium]|nr:MAG: 3'(2'),5'-bisphosphate nucleotidase [Rickettsiales bacterium]
MDKSIVAEIKEITTEAGAMAVNLRNKGLEISLKEDSSPVTNADKAISSFIFDRLTSIAPDIPVICEERPPCAVDTSKQFWLIDPIDGTRSFIDNTDNFTVNIALIDNKSAAYGFIYQPTTGLLYFTDAEQNFCVEENGIKTIRPAHGSEGLVAVVSSHHLNEKTESFLASNSFSEIVSIPSSIKLCMLAEGRVDIYPKFGTTMEWDIAAGDALIRAAGGKVCTLSGEIMQYAKKDFRNNHFIAMGKRWNKGVGESC